MRRLSKFLQLSVADRVLVIKSAFLVGGIRLGLWLLPFWLWRDVLEDTPSMSVLPLKVDQVSVDRIAWAVTATSRYIPGATCLTQALAVKYFLSRLGHPVLLRLGVVRDRAGQLRAHAWIESQGQVIIGGADSSVHFTPLSSPEGGRQ